MTKEIPCFSARRMNAVSDYSRFHHSRTYLMQRSALFPGPASNPGLMLACGYKKAAKFARHRVLWDALGRPVPLGYLEAIGAGLEVLAVAAEADKEEYRAALAIPLFPQFGIERMMPAIYGQLRFPPFTSENEAVSILIAYSRKTGHECCVNFPGLKAVFVYPTGSVSPVFFEPRLSVVGGFVVPGGDGRTIGTCSVGR